MNTPVRRYEATPAARTDEPLLIGMIGPPGGGKTFSALRIAAGIQSVRGGDVILIDTESGRARKYADQFKFLHVDFQPPHQSHAFLEAIQAQLPRNPACIIVDSASDEHEGQGGYLEWHDEMVPKMGGNEWAAWAKPKASRKRMINGLLHIRVPLIFTFRAREKTQQKQDGGKKTVVNIGWMPVAPLEIVHSLDLTCILPPRADGVPIWESSKVGEDFIVKLPNFLAPLIETGALNENTGKALAQWAKGTSSPHPSTHQPSGDAAGPGAPVGNAPHDVPAGASEVQETDSERLLRLDDMLAKAAVGGMATLQEAWAAVPKADKPMLKASLDRRHKAAAESVGP